MPSVLETVGPRTGTAPLTYQLSELGTVDVMSIFAAFDGTSASGAYRPVVTVRSQSGAILARSFPGDVVNAGDSADVTFAPFLGGEGAGGLLEVTDGSTVVTSTTTIGVGAGLVLSSPAAGEADIGVALSGDLLPAFSVGYWYSGQFVGTGTATTLADMLSALPLWVPTDTAFDRIGVIRISGSNNVRLGIYANDHGWPGALVLDAGTVNVNDVGVVEKSISIAQTLTRGIYWLAHVNQGAANSLAAATGGTGGAVNTIQTSTTLTDLLGGASGYAPTVVGVPGALPNPWTGKSWFSSGAVSRVFVRAA